MHATAEDIDVLELLAVELEINRATSLPKMPPPAERPAGDGLSASSAVGVTALGGYGRSGRRWPVHSHADHPIEG